MRAAFYECDVTPPIGGYLWGYYSRRISEDVSERLYAKAVIIEDEGNIAALVSVDACSLPEEMHDIVTQRIYNYTGIKPENVCISATHTHKGVPIFSSPEIDCFKDEAYTDVFYRLTADAVILAYKRLGEEAVEVTYGTSFVDGVSFNRNAVTNDGTYVTHPRWRDDVVSVLDEVDKSLNIITFSKNGKKIGSIINFSLHLDSTGRGMWYSSDYAGIISDVLKEKYGNSFVSLFVTGACGDVNHMIHDENIEVNNHKTIGKILGSEAIKVIESSSIVSGSVCSFKETISIEKRSPNEKEYNKLSDERSGRSSDSLVVLAYLRYAYTNKETHADLKMQIIKIGDICICALPGEIYTRTGLNIKQKSPFEKTIIVENSNCYCGYIPTENAFEENSRLYEAALCNHSCLVPEAAQIIEEKALSMIEKIKE